MDILSVDVTPLASGAHATSCPDMSVAASKSVDLATSVSADFDDRTREIQNTATSEFADTKAGANQPFRNPSIVRSTPEIPGKNH